MEIQAPERRAAVFQLGVLRGALRIDANGFYADDTGFVKPLFIHVGDGFARWCRGEKDEMRRLARGCRVAGFHGWRSWTILDSGDHWYWHGYTVGPHVTANYEGELGSFGQMLNEEGLKWVVSQGDLLRVLSGSKRVQFMEMLTRVLPREWVAEVDCANEAPNNGMRDAEEMIPMAQAIANVWPDVPLVLSSSQSEETDEINALSVRPCNIFSTHSSRGGDYVLKLRHPFSTRYETGVKRRCGHNSEPPGICDWSREPPLVSATSQGEELDADFMSLLAIQSLSSAQALTFFSGAGVKSDLGEDLLNAVGFVETPKAVALLPTDIMTWPTYCHGGSSQTQRVFAVPGTDDTRADHTIAEDGRFCVRCYGSRWREVYAVKDHRVELQRDFGDKGRVILGRMA